MGGPHPTGAMEDPLEAMVAIREMEMDMEEEGDMEEEEEVVMEAEEEG